MGGVSLPFADATFDVGVMALVIAFIPDAAKAVAELARVVKTDGLISTYMWDIPEGVPATPLYRAYMRLGRPPQLPPNPEVSKVSALENLWKNAGLKDVETTTLHIEISFDDFNDFWQTITQPIGPQGKAFQSLPAEFKAALKEETRTQLPVRADGRIVYGCFANAVKGRKPS